MMASCKLGLIFSKTVIFIDDGDVVLVDVDVVFAADIADDVEISLDLIIAGNWMSDNGSNAAAVSALLLGLVFSPSKRFENVENVEL